MTSTAPRATSAPPGFRRRNVVGLVILGLLGAFDLLAFVGGDPGPGEVGPPAVILYLVTFLGVVTVAAVVVALVTRRRGAVRIAAGARILSALSAVPAFFAGAPGYLVASASIVVVLTVTGVVLALAQPAPLPAAPREG